MKQTQRSRGPERYGVICICRGINFNILWKGESKESVICTTIPKLSHGANYFECNKPVVGSFLNITLARGPRREFVLCEVEVFQTKIGEYVLLS